MSDVQDTTTASSVPETAPSATEHTGTNGPIGEAITAPELTEEAKPETAAVGQSKKTEETALPVATETKTVEPLSEGILGYKAPGLLKQFTFSKKDFWLNDEAVVPQHMDMYLRGEKSEISNPVVAWASQTGKGLLFFTKKTESNKTHPSGVLALYDAEDLEKQSPHEFSFKLHGHKHQFKAANDAERDGWYMAIEKAIELGKASKQTIRETEGYKAEIEKLNTPNTISGGAAAVAAKRSLSQPKKGTEVNKEARREGSSSSDEEAQKKRKSRSTSRGMLNKLKGKKDEMETKRDEKKEEKEIEREEKKGEKEIEKPTDSATPAALASGSAFDPHSTADRALDAPVEENPAPVAESGAAKAAELIAEEKPKTSKRGSIFGRMQSGFSSIKSPSKEKTEKDAELKPVIPPKDHGVSETAPQLPEPTSPTEPTESAAVPAVASLEPQTVPTETKPAVATHDGLTTPNKDRKSFLSGLPFLNKRDRSVSPSTAMKDHPINTDAPAVPAKDEPVVPSESTPAPVTETTAKTAPVETTAAADKSIDKPMENAVDPITESSSPSNNKRQSILGNFSGLGRRASKAFGAKPKKESVAPTTTEPKTEEAVAPSSTPAAAETTEGLAAEEKKAPETIGDVDAGAITSSEHRSTPTVSATA